MFPTQIDAIDPVINSFGKLILLFLSKTTMKYKSKSKSKTSPKEQELLYLLQKEYECEK